MTMPHPRLPVEPLLEATGLSLSAICRRAEKGDSSVRGGIRQYGGITPEMADDLAVACGWTATEIWGDDWLNLPDGTFGFVDREEELVYRRAQRALSGRDPERDNARKRAKRAAATAARLAARTTADAA